jgi:TIR domain
MTPPRAFISYSHDSPEHKRWVLQFATRLRSSGIDAILDQWELEPGADIPQFMEQNLSSAERVVMICTSRYVEKANLGKGGVGYEKMIVTSNLLQRIDSRKVIPVIRQHGTTTLPTFLSSKLFVDMSKDDDVEFGFDQILRALLGAPLFVKPQIGNNPLPTGQPKLPDRKHDLMREMMRVIVLNYETTGMYIGRNKLFETLKISRILFDITFQQAEKAGLFFVYQGEVHIKDEGRMYAVEHSLIN